MKNKRSFTLLEILISLCIVAVVATISLLVYRHYVEKAKSAEAVIAVSQISSAEELHKMQNGTYIAADNTQQVNERLGMNIVPKYYDYRVVGISQDNFIVIAQRIGLDISENMVPESSAVIALDRSGVITSGYQPNLGGESAGGQILGGANSGGSSVPSGGGAAGGSGGGAPGGAGGGTTGGAGGETPSNRFNAGSNLPVYNADPNLAVEKLAALTDIFKDAGGNELDTGKYYYDLIKNNKIVIFERAYADGPGGTAIAEWVSSANTIYINSALRTAPNWSEEAVACAIMHEAVHADFDYNPDKWATRITEQWGSDEGFTADVLYQPGIRVFCNSDGDCVSNRPLYYTQIQEYFTHSVQSAAWLAIKGTYSNQGLDDIAADYQQGEAALRNYITGNSYYGTLPVFYEGEPT